MPAARRCQERGRIRRLHPGRTAQGDVPPRDAIKIDLKAYSQKFYREIVNGDLPSVLKTLVAIRKYGVWSEIGLPDDSHLERLRRRSSRAWPAG